MVEKIGNTQTSAMFLAPPQAENPSPFFSKTNWKTYIVAVSTFLLLGIGYALAFSSVYLIFAVHIHPLLATTPSVLSIAAGHFLAPQSLPPPTMPCGMSRSFRLNHCWANTAFQILFSNPNFCQALFKSSSNDLFIEYLKRACLLHLESIPFSPHVSPINSQATIAWLKLNSQDVRSAPNAQHSPNLVLEAVADLLPLYTQEIKERLKVGYHHRDPSTLPSDCPIGIELATGQPFLDLLENYFHTTSTYQEDHTEKTIEIDKFFFSPPPFLFFAFNRIQISPRDFKEAEKKGIKNQTAVEVPFEFRLPSTYTKNKEEGAYMLTGFALQEGIAQAGHYTSCVYHEGSWYHINDANVRKLSLSEAKELSKQATLTSYTLTK